MNYNSVDEIIEYCPNLRIFKGNDDLKKNYYENWKKYIEYKRKVYEVLDIQIDNNLVSEANWILRSKSNNVEDLGVNIRVGDICYIDFGQAYINESAYQHFGIIMNICNNKVLVIPMTSNNTQYDNALDDNNPSGKIHLLKIGKIKGMNKPSVLFMNDIKYLNSSRIIDVKAHINKDSKLFKIIQNRMYKIIFN